MNPPIDPSKLTPGTALLGYKILSVLGIGGFGAVYKATQTTTGQLVAIKFLLSNRFITDAARAEHTARFEREMQLLARLKHPNIVNLVDSGEFEGNLFMVLEFVEGEELADRLSRGVLEAGLLSRVMVQVLEALAVAHGAGVIHRDLKPQNIMLTGPAHRPHAKVLDFGIANLSAEHRDEDWQTLTQSGMLYGTPAYMAPEQIKQKGASPQSDIYAMGLILLECLTGRRAVTAETPMEVALKQVTEGVFIPPEIQKGPFGPIIQRACAKEPSERFRSAEEMLLAIEAREASGAGIFDQETLYGPPPLSPLASPAPTASTEPVGETIALSMSGAGRSTKVIAMGIGLFLVLAGGAYVVSWGSAAANRATSQSDESPKEPPSPPETKPIQAGAQRPPGRLANEFAGPTETGAVNGLSGTFGGSKWGAQTIGWNLRSEPVATVYYDDEEVCVTPCEFQQPQSDGPVVLILRAQGYLEEKVQLDPNGGDVEIGLHRKKSKVPTQKEPKEPGSIRLPEYD